MTGVGQNPFKVFSPEGLSAEEVVDLFVPASPGVDSIKSEGHSMLVGPRGAGKSMLFRFLEPDCQLLFLRRSQTDVAPTDLPFYTAYLTVKDTEVSRPSLQAIKDTNAALLINEHVLVLTILTSVVRRALKNGHFLSSGGPGCGAAAAEVERLLANHTHESTSPAPAISYAPTSTEAELFVGVLSWLDREYEATIRALDGPAVKQTDTPFSFDRTLLRFTGFLVPFVQAMRRMPSLPKSKPFFLAIDDADGLTEIQTRILNTFLARRISEFSIKVSYEIYCYKTFYTAIGSRILSPHDFQEIKISDVHTSNTLANYNKRMRQIIERRLLRYRAPKGSNEKVDVDEFFPKHRAQTEQIARFANEMQKRIEAQGSRSARPRDDIYRYLIPEFITRLSREKSRSKFFYAGFDQLTDISSGVPRYFLEAAQLMFDRQLVKSNEQSISKISPEIQNIIVREMAANLLQNELQKVGLDESKPHMRDDAILLQNLISCLGSLFEAILLDSSRSERRVFSFAISDYADSAVERVLRLGLQLGYLTRETIGRKEGFGRTDKYVLSRRLAPNWNLDPSGFSAYQFLCNEDILFMMTKPNEFRKKLRRTMGSRKGDGDLAAQLPLFSKGG